MRIITQASPSHQGARVKQNKQQRYGQGQQKNGKDGLSKKENEAATDTVVDVEEKENYLQAVRKISLDFCTERT